MLRVISCPGNLIRRTIHISQQRHGFIVLVPEIGEDPHAADGILQADTLPAFNDISIENCLGAIGAQALAVEKTVGRIEQEISENSDKELPTSKIFHEFDVVTGPLDTTWGIAKALYLGNCTRIPTKSYMNIHERARNARASKYNSKILYDALIKGNGGQDSEEQRLVQKFILEGKLNGLSLESRDQLNEIISKLGQERASFKNKVNKSISSFSHIVNDEQVMRAFPISFLEATAPSPQQSASGPWHITLQPQIVDNFLKYCPDRMQRWNIWSANTRKASSHTDKSLANSTHLEKIRDLRQQQAKLLGFKNYAEMSMQTKMIGGVDKLHKLFAQLLQYAGPAQLVEISALQQFANSSGFDHKLDIYDIAYWQRKHLLAAHNYNEQELRNYFPLQRVMQSLFGLCEMLFQIQIVERVGAQVWQPAVKYYDVFTKDSSSPVAGFYVDCYSKDSKFANNNNGYMVSIRNRNAAVGQIPLCALIFNFMQPIQQQQSMLHEKGPHENCYLLGMEDLRMLFRTFGTAMQHLLTRVNYTDLAGISNIEWDASQVVGNVMSNFLNNPSLLQKISAHYESEAPISDAMAGSGLTLERHLAGHRLCQQLYLSHLDLELHESSDYWLDIVKKLWPVYHCMPLDKKDAHPCSMTDIFSGDWAAACFSHLYSKVIAADISQEFEENSADYTSVGTRFRDTYLSLGGSLPAAEVFRRFRGRDPSIEALIKNLNIHRTTQTTGDL